MLRALVSVAIPLRETHELPALAILRALGFLGLFIFLIADLVINERYLRYENGVTTRDVRPSSTRLPPWNLSQTMDRAYCHNDKEYQFEVNDLGSQYSLGRWCSWNFMCNVWINTRDIVGIAHDELTLVTSLSGLPEPAEPPPFLAIETFYAPQLAYYNANFKNKSVSKENQSFAWFQLMMQPDLAYTCSPSFFVVDAEYASVFVYHGVDSPSTGQLFNPKTTVYDGNGNLIRTYAAGEVLSLNFVELLGMSLDADHGPIGSSSLNGHDLSDPPPTKLRTIGTQATLSFLYHNRNGEVECEIKVNRFPKVLGFLPIRTVSGRFLDNAAIASLQAQHIWGSRALPYLPKVSSEFNSFGIKFKVTTEVSMGVTDLYQVLQHVTSVIVLGGVIVTTIRVLARAWVTAKRKYAEQQQQQEEEKTKQQEDGTAVVVQSSEEGSELGPRSTPSAAASPERLFSPRHVSSPRQRPHDDAREEKVGAIGAGAMVVGVGAAVLTS